MDTFDKGKLVACKLHANWEVITVRGVEAFGGGSS